MAHLPIVPDVYAVVFDSLVSSGLADAEILEIFCDAIEQKADRATITQCFDPWIFQWSTRLSWSSWTEGNTVFPFNKMLGGYPTFSGRKFEFARSTDTRSTVCRDAAERLVEVLDKKHMHMAYIGFAYLYSNERLEEVEKCMTFLRLGEAENKGIMEKCAYECLERKTRPTDHAALLLSLACDGDMAAEIALSVEESNVPVWFYNLLDRVEKMDS